MEQFNGYGHLDEDDEDIIDACIENLTTEIESNSDEAVLIFQEATNILATSETRAMRLLDRKFFSRILGSISGSDIERVLDNQRMFALAHSISLQLICNLADRVNLGMASIAKLNIQVGKVAKHLINIKRETPELISKKVDVAVSSLKSSLVRKIEEGAKSLEQVSSAQYNLNYRVEILELQLRATQIQLQLHRWETNINYQIIRDQVMFSELSVSEKFFYAARKYYNLTQGDWANQEYILTIKDLVRKNLPQKVCPINLIEAFSERDWLRHFFSWGL